jgi:hypothetical protein
MNSLPTLSKVTLNSNTQCSVLYDEYVDAVELSVGNTSIKLNGSNFVLFNEMVRKATAKILMNSVLNNNYQRG